MVKQLIAHYVDGSSVNIRLDNHSLDSVKMMAHYLFATHPHVVAATIVKGE